MDNEGNAITAMTIVSSEATTLENGLIRFAKLTGYEHPIKKIPEDYLDNEFTYPKRHEGRCTLCQSTHRDMAELVYLRSNKNVSSVVKFFEEYFAAHVTWPCVSTHMQRHCDFSKISVEGLAQLTISQDQHMAWYGRENQLATTILMNQIDQVEGLEISNKPTLVLEKARVLRDLAIKLDELARARDERALNSINIFEVLQDLYNNIKDSKSKDVIRQKLFQIRSKLNAAAKVN